MNLIFKQLMLFNFGSYGPEQHVWELSGPPGLIYITGENKTNPDLGANDIGKSTLVTALYWAITGKTLRSHRPGQSIENWENEDDDVFVELEFTKNDEEYCIRRMRRPNALVLNGETVTQDRIFEVLGLSEEAIQHTLICGQFNEWFLNLQPEKQSALFAELLNLNLWLKASDQSSRAAKLLERELKELDLTLSKTEGSITEIASQQESTEAELVRFDNDKNDAIQELTKTIDQLRDIVKEKQRVVEAAQSAVDSIPNIEEQEKEERLLQQKLRGLASALSTVEISERNTKRELNRIETQITQYNSSEETCPECGQKVTQGHIEQKLEGLTILQTELWNSLEKDETLIKERQKQTRLAQETLGTLQASIGGFRNKHAEKSTILDKCQTDLRDANYNLSRTQSELDIKTNAENPYIKILEDLRVRASKLKSILLTHQEKKEKQAAKLALYELWTQAYKEIRLDLIDETLLELEIGVNRHIENLGLSGWEVGFETERENAKGNIVHKFTTNIFPPNINSPVALETLGGGVSTRIHLGSFFGRSEILLSRAGILPNIEILDEPTRFLSDGGVDDLLESLKERAVALGRRIFFIDHSRLDHGAFDQVVWIEKTSEGSKIISQ